MNSFQKYNENMDLREMNIKALVFEVLKKWRAVLIIVVIATLLAVAFGFARGQGNDQEVVAQGGLSVEESQEVQTILDLEKQQEEAIYFQQNSVYMKMNPYNRNRVAIQYLINSEQGASQAIYEAIKGYVDNGGLAQQIAIEEGMPVRDIADSIHESSPMLSLFDNTNTTITIRISCYDEIISERLADRVEIIMGKYAESESIMGYSFTLEKIQRAKDIVTDMGLLNNQRLVITDIDGREAKIDRLKATLNPRQRQLLEEGKQLDASSSTMGIWRYLLLGFFAGLFISFIVIDIKYILNGNLKSKEEMKGIYGIKVFGELYEERKQKFVAIDRLIHKLEGEDKKQLPIKQSMDVIGTELSMMCKIKKINTIYVTVNTICEKSNTYLVELQTRLQKEGLNLVLGNRIVNNPEAMKRANEIGNIIIVETINKSRYEKISSELQLCSEYDINVCGTILVNM